MARVSRVRQTSAYGWRPFARTYGSVGQDHQAGSHPGARSHSQPRTTTDAHGAQTAVLGVNADPPDQSERLVETYRSKGVVPAAKANSSTPEPPARPHHKPLPTLSSSQFSSQFPSFFPVRRGVQAGYCAHLQTARTPANSGGGNLESGLGASPRGFESRILRNSH